MNILQDLNNPWNVPNLSDFMFYNCPECVYKSKDDTDFQTHAVVNHPQAKCFFEKLEENHELILENNHNNISDHNPAENELKIKTEDLYNEENDSKILDSKFFDYGFNIHEDEDEKDEDEDLSDSKVDQSDFDWFPESTSDLEQKYENPNSNQTRSKNRNLRGSKSNNSNKKKIISRKKVDDIDNNISELASSKKDYLCEYCLMKFPKLIDVKQHIQGD